MGFGDIGRNFHFSHFTLGPARENPS